MTLKEFLDLEGESASKLAADVGVSLSTITRAAAGLTFPKPTLRLAITQATGGRVTLMDMLTAYDAAQMSGSGKAA